MTWQQGMPVAYWAVATTQENTSPFDLSLVACHLEDAFCLFLQFIQLWLPQYKTNVDNLEHVQWRATTKMVGTGAFVLLRELYQVC